MLQIAFELMATLNVAVLDHWSKTAEILGLGILMSGFSIDLAAERIVDTRTRSYFVEVARSFSNECYRSSIVMLWTTVVCDLVYKLQSLRDLYGDTAAERLLNDLEKKRDTTPNKSDWESFLLEEVAKRTNMLETSEVTQLRHLRELRHLSAHPVLSGSDLLFAPTKEDARAQIRFALETVLLRPALFSKRIVDTLVEDIAANKDVLISRDKLKAYLEARYLPNMPRQIELELFRTFWKFCFKLNNVDTKAHRKINLETLVILFGRNPAFIREAIGAERAFFSNVGPDAETLDALVEFLAEHPDVYASLNSAAHVLIDDRIDADINNLAKARFKFTDTVALITEMEKKALHELGNIADVVWVQLVASAEEDGAKDEVVRLAIKIYSCSRSFDSADRRFTVFLEPVLSKLTPVTMGELLGAIEEHDQTYGRGRASVDHRQIKNTADALGVDTTVFKLFTKYL